MLFITFQCIVIFLCFVYLTYIIIGGLLWFFNRRPCKHFSSDINIAGKTVIITGASAGIGKEAAFEFGKRKAKLILACRNLTKAQRVADEIIHQTGNDQVLVRQLDTSSLSSVRSFAKTINDTESRLDILVLNAGRGSSPTLSYTEDDLENVMATNHFGHFLLANLLLDLLKKSSPSRIIVTSSRMHFLVRKMNPNDLNFHKDASGASKAYSLSKLCNILFTRYLSYQLHGKGVTVNCFCPGLVKTDIFRKKSFVGIMSNIFGPIGYRTPKEGAQTLIYLALAEDAADISGAFFTDCQVRESSSLSQDAGLIKKVWEKSEELVSLNPEERD